MQKQTCGREQGGQKDDQNNSITIQQYARETENTQQRKKVETALFLLQNHSVTSPNGATAKIDAL